MKRKGLSKFLNQLVLGVTAWSVAAQPILAQTIAVSGGPTITNAPNDVPMVMIETPNSQGVSHNRYDRFNVGPEGLLLNNIAANYAGTDLAGIVPGNANLAGGAASIILNEVVSPNISTLEGYLEVAGSRADVILANPYGITCNGCGFLNMDRMTLATGVPVWEGGSFTGLGIDGGAIEIGERGADALGALRFDLLSRQISVAGAVEGQRLRVVAGRNDVIYATDEVISRGSDGSAAPELAIDSTVLGGMYAGSITIQSTEAGVGVRAPQNMAASTGEMRLTADGRLVMGRASSQGAMRVQSRNDSVELRESLAARQALEIAAAEQILIENNARLVSEAALSLQAANGVSVGDGAEIASVGGLDLDAGAGGALIGAAARVLSHGDVRVSGETIVARGDAVLLAGLGESGGSWQARQLQLEAGARIDAAGAQLLSGGDISANARIIDIAQRGALPAGRFVAQGDIDLTLERLEGHGGAIVAQGGVSLGDQGSGLTLDGGVVQADGDVTLSATGDATIRTDITSLEGGVDMAAQGRLALEGDVFAGAQITGSAGGDMVLDAVLQAQSDIDLTSGGQITTAGLVQALEGDVRIAAAHFANSGDIGAGRDLTVAPDRSLENSGLLFAAVNLQLGSEAEAPDGISNLADGRIIGGQDVTLWAGQVINAGVIGAQSGALTVQAAQDILNEGLMQAEAGMLGVSGRQLVNTGDMIGGQGIGFDLVQSLENSGLIRSLGAMSVLDTEGGSRLALLNHADGEIIAQAALSVQLARLENAGTLASAQGALVAEAVEEIRNSGLIYGHDLLRLGSDGEIDNDAGVLLSAHDLQLLGARSDLADAVINRNGGLIESFEGDVRIAARLIRNIGPEVSVRQEVDRERTRQERGNCSGEHQNCYITRTTTTVTTDIADISGAPSMIISGRDIDLSGQTAHNAYGLISAQRDIRLDLETLLNEGVGLNERTEVAREIEFRQRRWYWLSTRRSYTNEIDPPVTEQIGAVFATIEAGGSIYGEVSGYLANGAVAMGADVGGPSGTIPGLPDAAVAGLTNVSLDAQSLSPIAAGIGGQTSGALGNGALFVTSVSPDAQFLLETRHEFIDLSRFLSSDYFLSSLNHDPERLQKRFGDAWAETLFVREQMFRMTGQGLGHGDLDAFEQMRRLYDGAIDAAERLDLTVGLALTPAQIAALSEDIIWLEEAVVNGERVLVPRLYLASAASLEAARSTPGGSTLSAGLDISLLAGEFVNSGSVAAGRNLRLEVEGDLANLGGMLGAQNVASITVAGTLSSVSGGISAEYVQLAARDIAISTGVLRSGDGENFQEAAASAGFVQAGSELRMLADRGIHLLGAEISSGGDAVLAAGDGIHVGALALEGQRALDFRGGYYRAESLSHETSRVMAGGDLLLLAQTGDIVLEGARLDAGGGLGVIAQSGNVVLAAVADHAFSDLSASGSGFLSSYSLRDQRFDLTHQVAQLSAQEIDIFAAGMIHAEGTRFETSGEALDAADALRGGDLRMTAGSGSILVSAPTDISARSYQRSSSYLGGLIGSSTDRRSLDTQALRTQARVAGMIDLAAGQDLVLTAVDFEAGDILRTQVGGNTYLLAAVDTDYAFEQRMRNNGITITTVTQEDYRERATFNELRAAGFEFDEGSPVTFDALRDPLVSSAHAAALVNPGEAQMALAAMFLGTTDPATGPPAGSRDDNWRAGLDMRQVALPNVSDGPGFGYIDPLLDRGSTINNAVMLIDQQYYDRQVELNPAFKALVSIVVSAYIPGLGELLNLSGAVGAAATAFGNSLTVGMIEGAITGNMDIADILEGAAFSGVTAGLTAGISLQGMGVEWGEGATSSLFGNGNLSIANLSERGLDAAITAALRTGVYGDDFLDGFAASLGASAAGLLMADLHNVVGQGIIDGYYSEGDLAHVSLHALVGCAMAEFQGADCGPGAVGGAVSALYGGYLERNGGVPEDARAATIARAELIGALAGYFVSSGRGENVSTAGGVAASALENNYLTVQDIADLTAELEACQEKEGGCSEEETRDLIDKYRELSARRDHELVQECGSDRACINQRLSEVASTGALAQVAALDPGVAFALVNAIEPTPMTWQQINANIERYHYYEHQCGSNAACLADPIGFHEMQILEIALSEVARELALSFYMDKNGNVVVVDTAIGGINAAIDLVKLGIPKGTPAMTAKQVAQVISTKQFVLSATGQGITLFQSDDPARQAAESAGVLAGGFYGGAAAASRCRAGIISWACAIGGSIIGAEIGQAIGGLKYDLTQKERHDE